MQPQGIKRCFHNHIEINARARKLPIAFLQNWIMKTNGINR